jgi:hypothetical protein
MRSRIDITVPRNRHPSSSRILIHRPQDRIPDEDITTIDGIPVTKPARTLLDLATVVEEDVVERCLDDALRRRLVSLPFLERWLADPRRKRKRGAPVLRRLIAARATVGVTECPLETQVLRLLQNAGLPIPMLQYIVRDRDRFVARLTSRIRPSASQSRPTATGTTINGGRSTRNEPAGTNSRHSAGVCSASPPST